MARPKNSQKRIITTSYTDLELRQLIREELLIALSDLLGNRKQDEIDNEVLTLKEAAIYLKYSIGYMYQLIHHYDIPHSKSGKRILFLKDELDEWVKNRE